MGTLSSLRGKARFYPEKQAAIFGRKGAFSQKNPKNAEFPLALCLKICYSITTLSPLIVIYRQVMPNHRKIGAFGGRKVKNRAITGNRKNRKSEDFW